MNIFKKKPKITEGVDLTSWDLEYLRKLNKINTKEAIKNGDDCWCWDEDVLTNQIMTCMYQELGFIDRYFSRDFGLMLKFTNDETRKLVIDFMNGNKHYDYKFPNQEDDIFDHMRRMGESYPETLIHNYWASYDIDWKLVKRYHPHNRQRVLRNASYDENNNIVRDYYTKEESDKYFGTIRIPDQTPEEREEFDKKLEEYVKSKGWE
jgi:hypothetical protein